MSNPVEQAAIRAMPAIDVIIFPLVYLCALPGIDWNGTTSSDS